MLCFKADGTRCSFIIYLGEVESYCPHLHWRPPPRRIAPEPVFAEMPSNLNGLFDLLTDNPLNFQWIKMRIERMWQNWVEARDALVKKQSWTLTNRTQKTVLLHLGFLTKESGFKFGEKSLKGGPLGGKLQ